MAIAVHRNTDSRNCGASTNVSGQTDVFINGLLCSVLGDPNSHGGGALQASNNDGTVFVNGILINLLGSDANADRLCPIPPHCNPKASQASPNVFACHGPKPTATIDETDPTREDLYPTPEEDTTTDGAGQPTGSSTGGGSGSGGSPNTGTNPATGQVNPGTSSIEDSRVRQAERGGPSNVVPPSELENDAAFQAKLDEMIEKYPGLTRDEIYEIIQGESGFDTRATNPSGATGLFQFMPATARELGYTPAQIQNMNAAEQLEVYDQYLDRWNYDGSNHLGIMQAAPAYASRSGGSVIYARGSAAWRQNPGWRPSDGGDITVDSINNYYRGQAV